MNWIFTRPHHVVRFEVGEPVCFVFPIPRSMLDDIAPRFAVLDAPMDREFDAFAASRNALLAAMNEQTAPADSWEKRYYRGLDMQDQPRVRDHQIKLRVKPFVPLDGA